VLNHCVLQRVHRSHHFGGGFIWNACRCS